MLKIRRAAYLWLISVLMLPAGLFFYYFTGKSLGVSHQALIFLFCQTKGLSNDILSFLISTFNKKKKFCDDTFTNLNESNIDSSKAIDELIENGFYVAHGAIPSNVIEELYNFTNENNSSTREMDGVENFICDKKIFTGIETPDAVRYDYKTEDLLSLNAVQELVSSKIILEIAQGYLNTVPKLDVLSMWWHTNYSKEPDSKAAQYFHFDMDRIKWIKVFIYLTDVGVDNGPHTFVIGSHKTNGIPRKFLNKGYARQTDDEVIGFYGTERVQSFIAPRGTIIFEDTRGLHKGVHLKEGSRLMLQLQYSNSLFGAIYPNVKCKKISSPNLKNRIKRTPEIFSNYYKI